MTKSDNIQPTSRQSVTRHITAARFAAIAIGSFVAAATVVLALLMLGMFLAAAFGLSISLPWAGFSLEGGEAFSLEVSARILLPMVGLTVIGILVGVMTRRTRQ